MWSGRKILFSQILAGGLLGLYVALATQVQAQDTQHVEQFTEVEAAVASLCEAHRKFDEKACVREAEAALATNPGSSHLWASLAAGKGAGSATPEAMAASDKSINLASVSSFAYRQRGVLLLTSGKFDEAIEAFTRAIELGNRNKAEPARLAYAYSLRGITYGITGRDELAAPDIARSLELAPGDPWIYVFAINGEITADLNKVTREAEGAKAAEASAYQRSASVFPVPSLFATATVLKVGMNSSSDVPPQALGAYTPVESDAPGIWRTPKIYVADNKIWIAAGNDKAVKSIYEQGAERTPEMFMQVGDGLAMYSYWAHPSLHPMRTIEGNVVITLPVAGDTAYPHCIRTDVDGRDHWPDQEQNGVLLVSTSLLCFSENYEKIRILLGRTVATADMTGCSQPLGSLGVCIIEDFLANPKVQYFVKDMDESEEEGGGERHDTQIAPELLASISDTFNECAAYFMSYRLCVNSNDTQAVASFKHANRHLHEVALKSGRDAGLTSKEVFARFAKSVSGFTADQEALCGNSEASQTMYDACRGIYNDPGSVLDEIRRRQGG